MCFDLAHAPVATTARAAATGAREHVDTASGKATDMIAGTLTFPRLPCPCTKRHVMPNLTSTGVCNTGTSALYACDVVTPRCVAAAAVVSALVLRRPTKEYTHPYSMMHRRLPTAGIEVAPHYHQLLVILGGNL